MLSSGSVAEIMLGSPDATCEEIALPWQVPWERKYLAGWGYLLSMDVVRYIVNATAHWNREPDKAPGWYAGLHWEDVLVGLVAADYTREEPQASAE